MTTIDENPILAIGSEKYLKCPKCQESEPYCPEHKSEVEALLARLNVA